MTSRGARQPWLSAGTKSRDIALPAKPTSCRVAREFVHELIGGAEDPRVALVVSELVANAVVHAHAEPQLRVGWDGRTLQVEVEDDGPGRPEMRTPDTLTSSGRGLALVDGMADDWGVADPSEFDVDRPEPDADHPKPESETDHGKTDHGKVVWARICLAD